MSSNDSYQSSSPPPSPAPEPSSNRESRLRAAEAARLQNDMESSRTRSVGVDYTKTLRYEHGLQSDERHRPSRQASAPAYYRTQGGRRIDAAAAGPSDLV